MKKRCGEEATKQFLNIQDSRKNSDFIKEIAVQLEPYWKEITDYQAGGFFKRLIIKLKYCIVKDCRAECPVPQHVLEAIADTMLPDIRAFFESEEGKREFEEWKAEQAEKKKKAG